MQSFTIAGSDMGLQTNKKPFLLPDKAFPVLENAYVWRDRVVKRFGLEFLGRLQRNLATGTGNYSSINGTNTFSIFAGLGITLEPNASIVPGNINPITIIFAGGISQVLTDTTGTGIFSIAPAGVITSAWINYSTGIVTITATAAVGPVGSSFTGSYYPDLPIMGIWQREIPSINDEETVFFDTRYAYKFVGSAFQEFAPGTVWAGTDADFFWATNWRGSTANSRLFFVTNFVNDINDPIRYTSGGVWTDFAPYLSRATPPDPLADIKLYQARILIPYFGRLLALNTWEGTETGSYAGANNFFARCRFSQIGDPTAVDAWRTDLFGKGGFIDAPTSEQITSAIFFKNTLIVFFERTTWQLRYVGEYGLPFIWERISSDFGSESTFSTILFDQGVAAVGDRAIISASAISVDRIDTQIPDFVFEFRNSLNGPERVNGIRDFQNELVYWSYNDFNSDSEAEKFPNHVLVYNYRNNTYAIFRDNVTFFGTFQPSTAITWDSETIFWDDEGVTWDTPANQSLFPAIVCGNQHGYVHYYNRTTPDEKSLFISSVDLTTTPIRFTIPDHNIDDGDIFFVTGMLFLDTLFAPIATDLNNVIYRAQYIDDNTIGVLKWDTTLNPHQYINNFTFTPASTSLYVGGGEIALFPLLNVQTKDFNPYLTKGGQVKLTYIDFLTDATPSGVMTVNIYADTQVGSPSLRSNIIVGNQQSETYLTSPYYSNPVADIAWHRFYATLSAQFIRIQMTYNDDLMNQLTTHQQTWVLNAITLWTRPGGKMIF